MLVLSRFKKQSIMIGDDIEIYCLGVLDDGQVNIGIKAPKNVRVDRREIYDKRKLERENTMKNISEVAQLEEDWRASQERLSRSMFAGEARAEWEAMDFVWHEPNQSLCYTHKDTTIYLYADAEADVYQNEQGPLKLSNVSIDFIEDLIRVIEG